MLKANCCKKVLLAVLLVSSVSTLAGAETFRFTASADNRPVESGNIPRWEWVLDEMTDRVGDEGVFHIMPGDFDDPQYTDASLIEQFGDDVVWYPVVGNHETETPADMEWIRNAYHSLPYIVNEGPAGCETTTYSWDYGNAHFVAINQYYNGVSDTGAGGDVVDQLYDWLAADLEANTQPFVFVIGHEPAYPEYRHVGDSLDQHPANRDRFWKLLNDEQVIAYICGHTHTYYAKQVDGPDWEPFTWQVDCGNSGNGSPNTFVDVTVTETAVIFNTWQGTENSPYTNIESWIVGVPYEAYRPKPANDAVHPETSAILSWTAGASAASHNVYFGENFDDVNDGTAGTFRGNVTETSFVVGSPESTYPQSFVPGVTYYWRVDEVNDLDPNSPWKGDVWSFTTAPGYATQPDPADNAVGAASDATLSWWPGLTAATHDVYFGTSSPPPFIGNQAESSFDPNGLEPKTTYYWQIDEIEADGTTIYTGDIWSFKTSRPGTGTILYEVWEGIGGERVLYLTSHPFYPFNPTLSTELSSFDAPVDRSDYFGGRIHGYLVPETSGDYRFWIASDDYGELWLSSDENPDNAVLISTVNGWTDHLEFDSYAVTPSGPISLVGGRKYYIMALYKEGMGGDNCAVAWQGPDSPEREVIAGYYLSPFVQLKAFTPGPADGATSVQKTRALSWLPGATAATHDVYFSADQQAVIDSTAFMGNQAETSYSPSGLVKGTVYYWRVDEVEADGTTIHTGDVWSFMTAPGYATQPRPADRALSVALDATLRWSPGYTAATHNVYFGTSNPPGFIGSQTAPNFNPGPLELSTTYYWQIDEIEADGTTIYTGDIWSFKTPRPGTGTILLEFWVLGLGTAVSDLTSNVDYPYEPIFVTESGIFEVPTNIGDAFGGRIHGFLQPETSGDYTFWIASDYAGELWLSTDSSPANTVLIAHNNQPTNPRQWDVFPEQKSDPIALTGGRQYYIMALYREDWDDDHCAAAWQGPDNPTRSVIDGYYLSPYANLWAWMPEPADGAKDVPRRPTLSWRPGATSVSYDVYLSTDRQAVADGTAAVVNQTETSYSPAALVQGATYYWRVDAVEADGTTKHTGDVWSFTVTTLGR